MPTWQLVNNKMVLGQSGHYTVISACWRLMNYALVKIYRAQKSGSDCSHGRLSGLIRSQSFDKPCTIMPQLLARNQNKWIIVCHWMIDMITELQQLSSLKLGFTICWSFESANETQEFCADTAPSISKLILCPFPSFVQVNKNVHVPVEQVSGCFQHALVVPHELVSILD